MAYSFELLQSITQGKLVCNDASDKLVTRLLIDSRNWMPVSGHAFFALESPQRDGHSYISDLYQKGCRLFVVSKWQIQEEMQWPDVSVLLVPNVVDALQAIASYHRAQFTIPVLGITGSNAKTIVKTWLAQILGDLIPVASNPKSYNSQVGVPLSVWPMAEYHKLGIYEAGISQPAEMQKLQTIIKPSLGLFTNLGSAHDEGFRSRREKLEEKFKLFEGVEKLFLSQDQAEVFSYAQSLQMPLVTWSLENTEADLCAKPEAQANQYRFFYKGTTALLTLPFTERIMIENVMHLVLFLLDWGLSFDQIQEGLQGLKRLEMRLQYRQGKNGSFILDDSYSNDLSGLQLSLEAFRQKIWKGKRIVVLSDISGINKGQKEDTYQQVSKLLKAAGADEIIGIGPEMQAHAALLSLKEAWPDTLTFLKHIDIQSEALWLVRGQRSFGLEKIVETLQARVHETILETNLDALRHNLQVFRRHIPTGTKIMAMVKAFAYGSGGHEVAGWLQHLGVEYLAVAYADEGVDLRRNGIQLPIMVMNPNEAAFALCREWNLEPELYSLTLIEQYVRFAHLQDSVPGVHIKLDTGMHRLGLEEEAVLEWAKRIQEAALPFRVLSVFSHLAATDEPGLDAFTLSQISRFDLMAAQLANALGYQPLRHILNSAGMARHKQASYEMVRLGIGLYGVEPGNALQKELLPVASLKTVVSQVRKVKAGDTVGYSRKGKVMEDTQVATIPVGYADGLDRRLSNGKGRVWIKGKTYPIIGNVCMDMCMIDVGLDSIQEGDQVEIFGKHLNIAEVAKQIDTIAYELMTGISERVRRVFVREG
jgi:alanine racemase